ncbi:MULTISPECIES: glycosyltransferase [Arthrobacter]|uniref:Glycosyltransferase n=1 Tax=Arthrobacter terricola TaxID=2547396 RepID=A0A4R5KBA0_9MICC|nr:MULTISPECIES: glycosyltransferase [Arthrobacter]MBT8163005.1 glycosyltransferase [Arthrobacter sp. GN70]TDF91788.1 glycosyltransferase [Arthrobacter terricola]
MTSVTLCVMTKNEEQYLGRCLESALDAVDELVVVDTGSSDRTIEIAKSYTDKVGVATLGGDFARARNVALDLVTSDWVVYIDADEQFTPESANRLRDVISTQPIDVHALTFIRVHFFVSGGFSIDQPVRAFRSMPHIRYENPIGESVIPAVTRAGGRSQPVDVTINHFGHLRPRNVREMKAKWYESLLRSRISSEGENADLLCKLAMVIKKLGLLDAADQLTERAVVLDPDDAGAHLTRGQILRGMDRADEALWHLESATELDPQNARAWSMLGLVQLSQGSHDAAEASFLRSMHCDPRYRHVEINLGVLDQIRGRWHSALERLERVADINPGFLHEFWPPKLEYDPFAHLDHECVPRFAGLPYHLAVCRQQTGQQPISGR